MPPTSSKRNGLPVRRVIHDHARSQPRGWWAALPRPPPPSPAPTPSHLDVVELDDVPMPEALEDADLGLEVLLQLSLLNQTRNTT